MSCELPSTPWSTVVSGPEYGHHVRLRAITTAVALIASLAACGGDSTTPGPELMTNGGFDTGLAGADSWDVSVGADDQTAEIVSDRTGNQVLELTGSVVPDVSWPQAVSHEGFPVEPGTRYRLSFRARSDALGLVVPIVWFADAAGEDLTGIGPGTLEVSTTDWTEYDFEFDAPDGAVAAHVIVRLALNTDMTTESSLTVDVDDVSVKRLGS